MGPLLPDTSYTLVIPQGLLETRDGMESPRIVHVFSTDSVWYARLQRVPFAVVQPGGGVRRGYLFVSEYVNSFNLPAWFSESYPFKVTWDLCLSLKPVRGYVVSWSEDMVKNGAGQGVAAYWMLVELETGVSACSADIVAEEMRGVFECECIDQEEVLVVE